MSSRPQAQPLNLRERIAALEQRNNTSQNQHGSSSRPTSPPPTSFSSTSATTPTFLTPQTTGGALKDRIAKFEKKGGVPVPRGSFGLGAPPPLENGPAKRRGELYGNRIPSSVKSHTTGPALSGGRGLTAQITGPSPPSWQDARHSFVMPSDGKMQIQIPGLDYSGNDEDTGGFAPPDSALGQPQGLPYVVPPVPDLPIPRVERRVASDSGSARRGVPFSTALDMARKAEEHSQGVYNPRQREASLSPQQTGQQLSDLGSGVEEAQTPSIVVSPDEPKVAEPEEIVQDDEVKEVDEQTAATDVPTDDDAPSDPPVASLPDTPPSDTADRTASEATEQADPATPEIEAASSLAPVEAAPPPVSTSPAPLSGDESDGTSSTATVQDTRVLQTNNDDDDDADLFVKPIKRKSPVNAAPGDGQEKEKKEVAKDSAATNGNAVSTPAVPAPHTPQLDRLMPSTPSKGTSTPTSPTPNLETPEPSPSPGRESFASQTVTLASRPESMADTSSPGHVSFAQRISPMTSRGVPVYLPGKTGSVSPTSTGNGSTPSVEAQPQPRRKESLSQNEATTSEFGVVTIGGSDPTRKAATHSHLRASTEPDPEKMSNRKSTFSAVVHRKVRETQSRTLPASLKNAGPTTPVKKRESVAGEPMSPGLGELAMLMQQSALLESRLIVGDYPDERDQKEKEKEAARREAEQREKEKQRAKGEEMKAAKLNRTNSMTSNQSQDSDGRNRKLSLKKVFGMGGKTSKREASTPLESIPATPPHNGAFSKDLSRSKSMELLSSPRPSQSSIAMPSPPSITLEPPPSRPAKAHSIHAVDIMSSTSNPTETVTSASASTSSSSGTGMDSSDEVPPTPPPKSPSGPGKYQYLSSIRRFASSSSRSGAYPPRHSVSTSSDDSVTVVTPPEYSPDFTGSRTLLETRTRTRSGSRSGQRIVIGSGSPGAVEEDRASVASGSGSLHWPSKSPRKGSAGAVSRAASFAEKMFSRSRTKSSTSTASSYDTDGYDGTDSPKVSTSMLSPAALPDVGARSPSLHELILSEPLPLSIPEMNEPHHSHSHSPTTPMLARPPSWISTSSTGTGGTGSSAYSRMFDKDFFDSFPAVPETTPNAVNHNRVNSSSTLRHA